MEKKKYDFHGLALLVSTAIAAVIGIIVSIKKKRVTLAAVLGVVNFAVCAFMLHKEGRLIDIIYPPCCRKNCCCDISNETEFCNGCRSDDEECLSEEYE